MNPDGSKDRESPENRGADEFRKSSGIPPGDVARRVFGSNSERTESLETGRTEIAKAQRQMIAAAGSLTAFQLFLTRSPLARLQDPRPPPLQGTGPSRPGFLLWFTSIAKFQHPGIFSQPAPVFDPPRVLKHPSRAGLFKLPSPASADKIFPLPNYQLILFPQTVPETDPNHEKSAHLH